MNIGEAAEVTGLPPKTIRYYEEIGLAGAAARTEAGYRQYDDAALHRLAFVARARRLGFTLDEVRQLLSLYDDRDRSAAEVKRLTLARIEDLRRKEAELAEMRHTLEHLADACHGGARPDCPILADLARGEPL
jgi:Cu(I)-responsive transcriptional regulator